MRVRLLYVQEKEESVGVARLKQSGKIVCAKPRIMRIHATSITKGAFTWAP